MSRLAILVLVGAVLLTSPLSADETILFEDRFEDGLSPEWQIVGLQEGDYRVKDGGLELRVAPGPEMRVRPMVKVMLPFTAADIVIASVDVTILDPLTEPNEMAGMCLLDESGPEFCVKKARVDRQLMFAPPRVDFLGEPGEEPDFGKYSYTYRPATDAAGPLRIIVRQNYAYFQVGPDEEGKYLNFFYSAIRQSVRERGFGLTAVGAPEGTEHWVRFDNFRVTRLK